MSVKSNLEREMLGERLAKTIGRISVNEAAAIAECSPNSFRRWLNGEVSANATCLGRIANHFSVSLDYLVMGIDQVSVETRGTPENRVPDFVKRKIATLRSRGFTLDGIDRQPFGPIQPNGNLQVRALRRAILTFLGVIGQGETVSVRILNHAESLSRAATSDGCDDHGSLNVGGWAGRDFPAE